MTKYTEIIDGNSIHIFPSSIARNDYPYARVLTEEHILDLIRNKVDSDSYVITESCDSSSFEFVIHGYYVKLGLSPNGLFDEVNKKLGGNIGNVYAHIFIDTSSQTHPQLHGSEIKTENDLFFSGIQFSDDAEKYTVPQNGSNEFMFPHYTLHLLHRKEDDNIVIPEESRKCIDGGEIS